MIGDSQIIKMSVPDYTNYEVLALDVHGTLVDWKAPLLLSYLPLLKESSKNIEESGVITTFRNHERRIGAEEPTLPYRDVIKRAEIQTRTELFGPSQPHIAENMLSFDVGKWPAFWDSVEAMHRLSKYFKIVAYSNADHKSLSDTLSGPLSGVKFDAEYIAEDIGCYKPDPAFMKYLIDHANEDFGVQKEQILIVAHGLGGNHVPAKELGLPPGVWIQRGVEELPKEYEDKVEIGAKFQTLKEFADTIEACFEGKGRTQSVTPEMKGEVKPHVPDVLQTLEDKGLGGS